MSPTPEPIPSFVPGPGDAELLYLEALGAEVNRLKELLVRLHGLLTEEGLTEKAVARPREAAGA